MDRELPRSIKKDILDINFLFKDNNKFSLEIILKDNDNNKLYKGEIQEQLTLIKSYVPTEIEFTTPQGEKSSFYVDTQLSDNYNNEELSDEQKQLLPIKQINNLGYSLVNILNNYTDIINECNFTKEKIVEENLPGNKVDSNYNFIYRLNVLKELIKKFEKILPNSYQFLSLEIYNFISTTQKENLEYLGKSYCLDIDHLINQNYYIKNKCINFITNFINSIQTVKNKIDKAFMKEKIYESTSRNMKLQLTQLNLPNVKIELSMRKENKKKEFLEESKYLYDIKTLEELCDITIYHINKCGNVLTVCKNCGKYFIPLDRTHTSYCDNFYKINEKGEKQTCRDYMENHKKETDNEIIKRAQELRNNIRRLLSNKRYKNKYYEEFKRECAKLDTKIHKYKVRDSRNIIEYCNNFMKMLKEKEGYTPRKK